MDRTSTTYAIAVLSLVAVVYATSWGNGFVSEDTNVQAPSSFGLHPSRWLSYATWVPDPVMMHVSSTCLHIAVVALLGVAALSLGLSAPVSMLIMGLHPLASQAVLYASARTDLLMTFGFLCGLLAVLRRHPGWLALSVVAVFAKEYGALVVLFWLWYAYGTRWFWLLLLVSAVLLLPIVSTTVHLTLEGDQHVTAGLFGSHHNPPPYGYWVSRQFIQVGQLLFLSVVPYGLSIVHDVAVTQARMTWSVVTVVGVVVAGLSVERTRVWTLLAVLVLLPRFVIRTTLEPIAEQHWYPVLCCGALACGVREDV